MLALELEESSGPVDELARHLAGAGDAEAAASATRRRLQSGCTGFADREAEQLAIEGLALEPAGATRVALLEAREGNVRPK